MYKNTIFMYLTPICCLLSCCCCPLGFCMYVVERSSCCCVVIFLNVFVILGNSMSGIYNYTLRAVEKYTVKPFI